MAEEAASKSRPAWAIRKLAAAKRAMTTSIITAKKNRLDDSDNVSVKAHLLDPLYGSETIEQGESAALAPPTSKDQDKKSIDWLNLFPSSSVFSTPGQLVAQPRLNNVFSSKQKTKSSMKVVPGFLRLPVEIRNQIYAYLSHQKLVAIKQKSKSSSQKDTVLDNAMEEYREPSRPKATKSVRIINTVKDAAAEQRPKAKTSSDGGSPDQGPEPGQDVKWATSLSNLLLTCKIINTEVGPVLYGTTAFYFDDAQRLRSFLKTINRVNLSCITRLHVHVRAYGIPNKAADNVWEQEHINCWASIFAKIAKKMTNLRVVRITVSMRSLTDSLKRAFKPVKHNTNWKERAGYMLMLQPLSNLKKLEDLSVTIKATDHKMQQYEQILPNLIYKYWVLANVNPARHLEQSVMELHHDLFDKMHHGLEQAMVDVGRSKDANKSFAGVALAVHAYLEFMMDPIGYMLGRKYGIHPDA